MQLVKQDPAAEGQPVSFPQKLSKDGEGEERKGHHSELVRGLVRVSSRRVEGSLPAGLYTFLENG